MLRQSRPLKEVVVASMWGLQLEEGPGTFRQEKKGV